MDNRTMYQQTQLNGYYPYMSYATGGGYSRPETANFMMPQTTPPAGLKGRPVTSFEEARVAQIDLDGSIAIFPDLGNKKIYTKRINMDGTASLQTYSLDEKSVDAITPDYVTKAEFVEMKQNIENLIAQLKNTQQSKPNSSPQKPLNF